MNRELNNKKNLDNLSVVWKPNPGSQCLFLSCPYHQVLYTGTRAVGKTDALIMDFFQEVGKGYGSDWRGILFRRTYKQLSDLVIKSKKWFRMACPKAEFNKADYTWAFPGGELLYLRYFWDRNDYDNYHGHCVDKGDILTKNGWIPIQNIKIGEKVLSTNKKNELSYQMVKTKTIEDYNGDLIIYNGRGKYMSFTPEHKLPSISNELIEYSKLPRITKIKNSGWKLTKGKNLDINYCKFMGWFLSEGYTNLYKKHYTIGICQQKEQNVKIIQNLLDNLKIKYNKTNFGFVWRDKKQYLYLSKFGKCKDKYIPNNIKQSNRECLQAFFDAYALGDGTKQQNRVYIYTISKKMSDDLQEIGVKLGYSVYSAIQKKEGCKNKILYTIAFNPKKELKLYTDNRIRKLNKKKLKSQIKRIKYNGKVYCLGVEKNHNFFIRQNGSTWLSGNSYSWIGWEELLNWPDMDCYQSMISCNRATGMGIPIRIRSTGNPWGIGRSAVKNYFIDPAPWGTVINDKGHKRVSIFGNMLENIPFMNMDPEYRSRLLALPDKELVKAWVYGRWDVNVGGFFSDVWNSSKNVIPLSKCFIPPRHWFCFRSFDWGSGSPFSVGWWTESDGTPAPNGVTYPRGTLIRFSEWYGNDKKAINPNTGLRLLNKKIGEGIIEREKKWSSLNIRKGPADNQIWEERGGDSIAKQMGYDLFVQSDKSRIPGWQQLRGRFEGEEESQGPLLYVLATCTDFIRTVPFLVRDDKNPDDIANSQEDHIADEVRYACMFRKRSRLAHTFNISDVYIA